MRIKQRVAELGYVKENGDPDLVRFALDHAWHPQYLDRWAKGTLPSRAHLEKLAGQLKTSAAWLHYGIGDLSPKAPRRQGRRTAGSLVIALLAGAGSLLGFGPPSGRGAAEAAVQRPAYIIRREALSGCFYSPYAVSLLGRRFASWLWNCTVSPVAA